MSDALQDAIWAAMAKGFADPRSLVAHQLNSFNRFVSEDVVAVINSFNPIEISSPPKPQPAAGGSQHQSAAALSRRHLRLSVNMSNMSLDRPHAFDMCSRASILTPNDARLRNMTYGSQITVDLDITATSKEPDGETTTTSKRITGVHIGTVPIMVGSNYCVLRDSRVRVATECPHDPAGYFVINGNEKVLVSLDRISENTTFVFGENAALGYTHSAEVRSVSPDNPACPKITKLNMMSRSGMCGSYIRALISSSRVDIPVCVLFRALGVHSDREIVALVALAARNLPREAVERELTGSLEDGGAVLSELEALQYLAKNMNHVSQSATPASQIQSASTALSKDLFPHVGPRRRDKAVYLAFMIGRLLAVRARLAPVDDRDSYVNKRIDAPGALMTSLFRVHFSKLAREMRTMLYKELSSGSWRTFGNLLNLLNPNNIYKVVRPSMITSGMTYALATGNWGLKNSRTCKQGVAQVLNRMTYNATMSHMRRVNTPIEKTGKLVQPRKLHPSHWGVVCIAETPEGTSIGLVKNLALTVSVSLATPPEPVLARMRGLRPLEPEGEDAALGADDALVLLNGKIVGTHDRPGELVDELRGAKRRGALGVFTSVVWEKVRREVRVNTEAGRCCRPLLVVDPATGRTVLEALGAEAARGLSLAELVCGRRRGGGAPDTPPVVEYLDVDEVNGSLLAMTPSELDAAEGKAYTHVEMSPAAAFGVVASTIPFPEYNQSPRNTYQCAMAKQAIGLYSTRFPRRFDTMAHVLTYPQRPVVNTAVAASLRVDSLPSGINAIVAIAASNGFNQEDSIILNRAFVERGGFDSTFYHTYKQHNSRNHSTGEEEHYYNPVDPAAGGGEAGGGAALRSFNYGKLTESGFVRENAFVTAGDVIVGKCMPHKVGCKTLYRDRSVAVKHNESGFVDVNCFDSNRFPTSSGDGYSFCKVRIRNTRTPAVGDKFSSRHGQKGTVGTLCAPEDMPCTADGVIPDMIINPHAIPSRMTIGQLMECVLGKACCFTGMYGDGTPFKKTDIRAIGDPLLARGLHKFGDEVAFDGRTGETMPSHIFVGPTYYQKLKHMCQDKCHARAANGPVTSLVRQPAEGRARDGGLRMGEMEVWCQLGHGSMGFLKERFMDCSDNYRVFTCKGCGCMSLVNPERGIFLCAPCGNTTAFEEIRVPYAFKLLTQELGGMGINVRFNTAGR